MSDAVFGDRLGQIRDQRTQTQRVNATYDAALSAWSTRLPQQVNALQDRLLACGVPPQPLFGRSGPASERHIPDPLDRPRWPRKRRQVTQKTRHPDVQGWVFRHGLTYHGGSAPAGSPEQYFPVDVAVTTEGTLSKWMDVSNRQEHWTNAHAGYVQTIYAGLGNSQDGIWLTSDSSLVTLPWRPFSYMIDDAVEKEWLTTDGHNALLGKVGWDPDIGSEVTFYALSDALAEAYASLD